MNLAMTASLTLLLLGFSMPVILLASNKEAWQHPKPVVQSVIVRHHKLYSSFFDENPGPVVWSNEPVATVIREDYK